MQITEGDLSHAFDSIGIDMKQVDPSVRKKALHICTIHGIEALTLANEWEAYTLNNSNNSKNENQPTIDQLESVMSNLTRRVAKKGVLSSNATMDGEMNVDNDAANSNHIRTTTTTTNTNTTTINNNNENENNNIPILNSRSVPRRESDFSSMNASSMSHLGQTPSKDSKINATATNNNNYNNNTTMTTSVAPVTPFKTSTSTTTTSYGNNDALLSKTTPHSSYKTRKSSGEIPVEFNPHLRDLEKGYKTFHKMTNNKIDDSTRRQKNPIPNMNKKVRIRSLRSAKYTQTVREEDGTLTNDQFPVEDINLYTRYRFMYTTLHERSRALESQVQLLSYDMRTNLKLTNLCKVGLPKQDVVTVFGRICNEAATGKLNRTVLVLEGGRNDSQGRRIKLKMDEMDKERKPYAFFPGQIVAIEGVNTFGTEMIVKNVHYGCPKPLLTLPAEKLFKMYYDIDDSTQKSNDINAMQETNSSLLSTLGGNLRLSLNSNKKAKSMKKVLVASGPYTTTDNLDFDAFDDLLRVIAKQKPDIAILCGPFIDAKHPMISEGNAFVYAEDGTEECVDFDTLFKLKISNSIMDLVETFPMLATQFILIPSIDDVFHDMVYPQPPLCDRHIVEVSSKGVHSSDMTASSNNKKKKIDKREPYEDERGERGVKSEIDMDIDISSSKNRKKGETGNEFGGNSSLNYHEMEEENDDNDYDDDGEHSDEDDLFDSTNHLPGIKYTNKAVPSPFYAEETIGDLGLPKSDKQLNLGGARIVSLSNPCLFSIDEISVAVNTQDILFHLSSEETASTAGVSQNRMARLASHLLCQQSFYPLFPPATNSTNSITTNIDLRHMKAHLRMPITPDICLLPSRLSPFAKEVMGSLVINPGYITKANSGGTYSLLTIHPPAKDMLEKEFKEDLTQMVTHKVIERTQVDVVRI